MAEATNETLLTILSRMVYEKLKQWANFIHLVLWAYLISKHTSTQPIICKNDASTGGYILPSHKRDYIITTHLIYQIKNLDTKVQGPISPLFPKESARKKHSYSTYPPGY